jgi:hypothetical protein
VLEEACTFAAGCRAVKRHWGKDGDDVKFGLAYNTAYYGADPDLMAAAARHAEECGFRVLLRA